MAGLSVDVGYWYNQAGALQKAADAAALAGVVWLPDEVKAGQYARQAAARNGYVDGADDVAISVEPVAGQNRRLRVTITDASVGSFLFRNLGGKVLDMNRSATAEYILPVPLGSPENVFGNDMTLPAAQRMGLWGNIHGPRTDSIKGDAYAPACRGQEGPTSCTGTSNPTYRPEGYLYAIDVPAGVSNMAVQVWDAGLVHRSAENVDTGDTNYLGATSTAKTTTTWTFYDADGSEIDVADNPIATSSFCSPGSGTPWTPTSTQARWTIAEGTATGFQNTWATLCNRTGTVPQGRYLLRVQTSGNGAGANRYAVRVTASSTVKPRLSAYQDMSMYNNISSGSANFYLAEVGPEHKGKTLEIRLYDPGEVNGDAFMQVMTPSGTTATTCRAAHDGATGGGRFTSGTNLSPCRFQTSSSSQQARYNGLWVTLQLSIPTTYTCTMGTIPGCWWKIRYEISGQASDTTTWAANVIGDPVHLVEEEAP